MLTGDNIHQTRTAADVGLNRLLGAIVTANQRLQFLLQAPCREEIDHSKIAKQIESDDCDEESTLIVDDLQHAPRIVHSE